MCVCLCVHVYMCVWEGGRKSETGWVNAIEFKVVFVAKTGKTTIERIQLQFNVAVS